MLIKIEKVGETQRKEGKSGKPYDFFEVVYDAEGRMGKKILFPKSDAGKTLVHAKEGENYEVELEKEGDYWTWKSATPTTSTAPAPQKANGVTGTKTTTPVKSTYETSEERAIRQVLIVRQSSLANAIAFSDQQKTPYSVTTLISLAEDFTNFVFQKGFEIDDNKLEPSLEPPNEVD